MSQILQIEKHIHSDRPKVIKLVTELKEELDSFTLIDIGGGHNPFNQEFLTHTLDFFPNPSVKITSFTGNLNSMESWFKVLEYVDYNGKFTFCNCTHTLEDIAYPQLALSLMPKIASQGFISVPSKYAELERRSNAPFRGEIHHRWIWDIRDNVLIGYPKISFVDHIDYGHHEQKIKEYGNTELTMFWADTIKYSIINNDYLGPDVQSVIDMYKNIFHE